MARRTRLGGVRKGEAHDAWTDAAGCLIVEWHDFGDDAPYESANQLLFDRDGQRALALALRAQGPLPEALAARFANWFEVKAFAEAHHIPFAKAVDFLP